MRVQDWLSLGVLSLGLLMLPNEAKSVGAKTVSSDLDKPLTWQVSWAPTPVFSPTPLAAEMSTPESFVNQLSASSIYAVDVVSGQVLLAKDPQTPHFPASTTKLMTALVARKVYDDRRVLRVNDEAWTQGTTMKLLVGEEMTVENLLKGLLIVSANDAAMVLANNHPEGYVGFTRDMNTMAKELHVNSAEFINPSGLDDSLQLISSRDLSVIARQVMLDPSLRAIVATQTDTVTDVTGFKKHPLNNTNALLGSFPGVIGLKTGTTIQAGQILVTYYEKDGRTILIVVMGSQDRYAETRQIIDWILARYTWQPLTQPVH